MALRTAGRIIGLVLAIPAIAVVTALFWKRRSRGLSLLSGWAAGIGLVLLFVWLWFGVLLTTSANT